MKGETYKKQYTDVGRNDPCPCGSGKKFKRCCRGIDWVII
ncbi:MAG: SEC-C domain-containing protein [Chitinispirillaceae bacterium]|nr:SEC-C domain-containing protein [Chitinispirillaceae bacterium]